MLLQPLQNRNVSLFSAVSYSQPCFPGKVPVSVNATTVNRHNMRVVCSISQIHSYGTVDYERRPIIQWNAIYKRISLMENPELGSGSVLNQWEKRGRRLTKGELCRVVKELRKYKRHKQALEVYDWMNNRGERFRVSASDAAIQLDLIGKVRGISSAEDFFLRLPDTFREKRVYGALLNAYARAKMREKAENLINEMREKGYTSHSLSFNVMMTLYMNLREYDKVEAMISEMKEKGIRLDIYSYNIWLSSCGSQGSLEKMEQVYDQMRIDRSINPNWTTFSTMATMYIKMRNYEKAEDCLRKVEARITGRDRIPYHYLLSLYGSVGNKEELYRVWKVYKSVFPSIPNLGYHAMISSLIRVGDIEGAEKMYEEWLPVKSSYDPRVVNLLMAAHVKDGNLDRAESLFDHMIEHGGKPSPSTWETLAEGHTREGRISEALNCLKEAFAADGAKSWRPRSLTVSAFFKLCEEESDTESKNVLVKLIRQSGYLRDSIYASKVGLSDEDVTGIDFPLTVDGTEKRNGNDSVEDAGSEMLLSQLHSSL